MTERNYDLLNQEIAFTIYGMILFAIGGPACTVA
jgi:hypothetical protein